MSILAFERDISYNSGADLVHVAIVSATARRQRWLPSYLTRQEAAADRMGVGVCANAARGSNAAAMTAACRHRVEGASVCVRKAVMC